MYDQSFNASTLSRLLQIGDERSYPSIKFAPNRRAELEKAVEFAHTGITTLNPLISFQQKGRSIFQAKQLAHQLVLRKLGENLRTVVALSTQSRDSIVSNLIHLLGEGVPYRIYRLDIKSFYESFKKEDVLETVNAINRLSPLTKSNIEVLFSHHSSMAGFGVPRGLALSASISELMMRDFDAALVTHPTIYFSARYVDDIVIVTSGDEFPRSILKYVEHVLPRGLKLNSEKTEIACFSKSVAPYKIPKVSSSPPIELSYLGYSFNVAEPLEISKVSKSHHHRDVSVDIASKKVTRIKTRITKSFIAFAADKDFWLLSRRLRFITANFSVRDARTGIPNLAGIFYSYPLLTTQHQLHRLDAYLRNAIISKTGIVYANTGALLTSTQRRKLLTNSFVSGHKRRIFMHVNGEAMNKIQECWKYE